MASFTGCLGSTDDVEPDGPDDETTVPFPPGRSLRNPRRSPGLN